MAKQTGSMPISGTIDNITYYTSKHGNLVRKKGGVSAKRLATGEEFARTREQMAEFGRAGRAGKLLRTAIVSLLKGTSDHLLASRLVRNLSLVVKSDPINGRGVRNVADGDITLMKGFEFNPGSPLSTTLQTQNVVNINRVTGELTWTIPAFVPKILVAAPKEATHFRIVTAGIEADFRNDTYIAKISVSPDMPWDDALTAELQMKTNVSPNSTHPLFLIGGIQFFQKIMNGTVYPLNNSGFNALQIVDINPKE